MTVNLTTLFTRVGKCFNVGNLILAANGTTIPACVESFLTLMQAESDPIVELAITSGIDVSLASMKSSTSGSLNSLVSVPVSDIIVEMVRADAYLLTYTIDTCLSELISQMKASGDTLESSAVAATVTYGDGGSSSGIAGDNTGDGVLVVSTKRPDGLVNEFILTETMTAKITSVGSAGQATWTITGVEAYGELTVDWPGGSGTSRTTTSHAAASGSSLLDGTFETEDADADNLPSGWVPVTVTLGTTLKMTAVEEQTVTVNGTPTGGFYILKFTDRHGVVYGTDSLAYNATASAVQTALQALPGLASVTVSSTGTSPDLTHTITFTDVTNPAQLTSVSKLTGGSPTITHATPTPGSAYVVRGARCLQFIGNGSELTELQVVISPAAVTQYGLCVWLCTDAAPATGVMVIDLVDGVGGLVIDDDQGTANSLTIDLTALTSLPKACTAMFRTPTVLPNEVYLRIRLTTAIENGKNVFVDELCMVAATELYTSGLWVAAFTGQEDFTVNDNASVVVTNDRAGKMHEWLDRTLGLKSKRVLFPTSGSPSQSDALIA